jgi:hypothetical protein
MITPKFDLTPGHPFAHQSLFHLHPQAGDPGSGPIFDPIAPDPFQQSVQDGSGIAGGLIG